MSKQTIWNYLKTHTELSDEAVAGIMGNMEAESNCEACRMQGDFSSDRSKSKEYARQTNAGANNFIKDSIGFGLCQWTYWSRKQNLLNCCRSYGKGVEDEEAQLAFMLAEMQTEYVAMWRRLLTTNTIADAAALMCREYERPAVLNITDRTKYGQQIYNIYHGTEPTPAPAPEPVPEGDLAKAVKLLREALDILVKYSIN